MRERLKSWSRSELSFPTLCGSFCPLRTKEKNNKYYNHGKEHFIPEPGQTAPDPQVENTLPPATTHTQNDG